ncbi:glucan endo-1,3-beta-glucosidase 3 [Selaginella moellendorffii]|uniref:glucan endo-1,3-beta-glucosidase 3 n=1 Tax=Selaginella moellendorffii TaxID=88036 RepID=UPI000D1C758D|nr:glucan endo-1,3-beta-glucosidase 3 [Selaginella moellendorffii]XP_024527481.1 glucan endo-1,3-beta-glucosidase 3 [Selaginella moellendorffii]|eukprot:XP_024527480.1 glucan endo-1,3-beta-glucosidase 3 [Selaginella moellendorffii]
MVAPGHGSAFLAAALALLAAAASSSGAFVGVNYGSQGDNLPRPQQAVDFMRNNGITQVRIFDADPDILTALAGTGIQVIIGLTNAEILSVGHSSAEAASWVNKNVMQFLPNTNITGIAVGSEVLTDGTASLYASILVATMKYIHAALVAANIDSQIKVSTPHSTALIQDPFPPSRAFFDQTYAKTVVLPLLDFLSQTGSYFMLNIYPLAIYQQNRQVMSIDYALLRPNAGIQDTITKLTYTNVFDQMLDAAFSAMGALNHTDVGIVVSETGWPSRGDVTEVGVGVDNAETYNNNLVRHILNNTGTPRRPGIAVNAYIYEIFNEDRRQGATSEKNYGIYYPDQTPVYSLDVTGRDSGGAGSNTSVRTWCVAKQGVSDNSLQAALDYACGQGSADCSSIQPGQACFFPDSVFSHASFAFNSYYLKNKMAAGTCDFAGVATVTTNDPSSGQCSFPSSLPPTVNATVGNLTSSTSSSEPLLASLALCSVATIFPLLINSRLLF